MLVDLTIPPPDWEEIRKPEQLVHRARMLVPLTLASAVRSEMSYLRELIIDSPRGTVPHRKTKRQEHISDELFECQIWSWKTDPFTLFNNLHRSTKQAEQQEAYNEWKRLLWGELQRAVAISACINKRPINPRRFREEKSTVLKLLRSLMSLRRNRERARYLQDRLDLRLRQAGPVLTAALDSDADSLSIIATPCIGDLGWTNTRSLIELFRKYPISTLGRCARPACGRFFVPGAENRTRTKGPKYCSEYCKKTYNSQRRKAKKAA